MLTLNQVITQITTLAAAHNQIAESGVGDFAEWQAEERNYPILWVFHESTSIGVREMVFSIRLICADRVIVGEEGDDNTGMEQEVLSDTLSVLLDFLAYFQQQHTQDYTVITTATIDPFTERLNDRLAGNSVVIQIRQPFTWNACQIPQTGATLPPTVDGLTLYDFCDPSVIARLTAPQISCLSAAICTPCAAATVTVNTTPFGTAPSGGGLNVPVVNGGDNPVGSIVAGEVVIANNATFINATQVTDQEAEVDANIFVTLDGAQSGIWNAGLQTWEVTSAAPTLSVSVSNANPQVGASITITATATGFTPTNYLFFAKQNGSIEYIGQNALGAISWTVSVFGAFDIYVQADNNVAASAFNIGGESVTSFVTITANVLYVNASDPNSYAGSGTAWNDLSVSNNDITLVNGVTWDGQSMLFNGTNQYAEAVDSASLDIVGAISITVWIKSTDITDGGIISKSSDAVKYFGSTASKCYEIGRFGNQLYLQLSSGIATNILVLTIAQTAAIYNGAWNSITFTWDGTTTANGIKYYLNGVLTAQATATISSIQSINSTLNIMGASGYFTQGRIGSVLISNSALSPAQITANYNSLRSIFP